MRLIMEKVTTFHGKIHRIIKNVIGWMEGTFAETDAWILSHWKLPLRMNSSRAALLKVSCKPLTKTIPKQYNLRD